ncbi:MAG TPA: bifunctional lysine ketoglutarate reductase /saccharopine dehydrogenase family protein [Bacteroidales bacterium]|nr:bifunctional lysine ketoglutarate reductase /saccharopine dehydrogenase family protein [Bacteroidales bacterium]HRX95612.1 bifunctional lysine ketoglutarate reductase /saccharopine dehydrogenase family protein [Bacteroidales bacterium]
MNKKIGIRHEDKYLMERRVAIIPEHIKKLIAQNSLEFHVERSPKRIFTHEEFEKAGARLVSELKDVPVVFGVKEMPIDLFETNKTYIFFSHVIKGQPYNMPMLKKMMEKKVNLIDYEKIADEMGRRLIFFGRFAGLAGMINSLWSLGQRYREYGIETPFLKIKQSHTYQSLEEAKKVISDVGFEIAQKGLPEAITPLTIGFTGYGNVSNGAQEIAGLLPVKEITPAELLSLNKQTSLPNNVIYKVVFKEADLSEPISSNEHFDLPTYYQHPEKFKSKFEQYIPHLTVLMNCMYWDDRYPRIVTKDYLEKLYKQGTPRLTVIGDVTCDPDGSIECTHKGTEIEDPVFVYDPASRIPAMGFKGSGLLIMAVDILPSELPRESSMAFSQALYKYIPAIAEADYSKDFSNLDLPAPIKRAMILHNGELTPDFKYIEEYL